MVGDTWPWSPVKNVVSHHIIIARSLFFSLRSIPEPKHQPKAKETMQPKAKTDDEMGFIGLLNFVNNSNGIPASPSDKDLKTYLSTPIGGNPWP